MFTNLEAIHTYHLESLWRFHYVGMIDLVIDYWCLTPYPDSLLPEEFCSATVGLSDDQSLSLSSLAYKGTYHSQSSNTRHYTEIPRILGAGCQ